LFGLTLMTSLAPRPRPRACGWGRAISHAWLILLLGQNRPFPTTHICE